MRIHTAAGRQPMAVATDSKSHALPNGKVDPAFRRRFRQRAAAANLKLSERLHEALEAWEEKQGFR